MLLIFFCSYQNMCAKGLQLNIYEILKEIKFFIATKIYLLPISFQSSAKDQELLKLAHSYPLSFSNQGRSFHAVNSDSL